jgi:hypothetical protein
MKIDIITPKHLAHTEEMMRNISNTLHEEIKLLRNLVMQLQDRIKMLEEKNHD